MSIEKLIEFAKTGDKNTDELDLDRGFPSRIYPARQWFNWLFNSLTMKINEIIDNKVDKSAISELSESDANEGTQADSKLISAKVLKNAITTHAPKPVDATTEIKGIVQLNNTLTSTSSGQALTAAQGKALNDQAFGVGQTWQNVTGQRISNTVYTNTTGKPIHIFMSFNDTANKGWGIQIGSLTATMSTDLSPDMHWPHSFVVPAGVSYKIWWNGDLVANLNFWWELR